MASQDLQNFLGLLIDGGVLTDDLLQKQWGAGVGELVVLGQALGAGVNFQAVEQQALNLSATDEAAVLSYLQSKLPDLGNAALQAKLYTGVQLAMQGADLVKQAISFGKSLVNLVSPQAA